MHEREPLRDPEPAPAVASGAPAALAAQVPGARTPPSPVLLARRAGVVGNRDLARLAATATRPARRLMRDIRTIRGERVSVHGDRQAAEAGTIIDTIEGTYGIDIDAAGTVSAVRADYGGAPLDVRRSVVRRHWKLRELRALLRACGHYARILGAARDQSSRHGRRQEVIRAGKANSSINDAETALDPDTLGEYITSCRTLALYQSGETDRSYTGDVDRELEFTSTHELAHGLMEYAVPHFISHTPYWRDLGTPSGTAGAEEPPTDYARTNAEEDMCETMALYFMYPRRLRRRAPQRYRWAAARVRRWTTGAPPAAPDVAAPPPASAPVPVPYP